MKIRSLLLLSLLTIAPSLLAQTPGIVAGRITERITGQPLAKAKITLEDKAETETDADGRYRLELARDMSKAEIMRAQKRAREWLSTVH